MRRFRVLAIVDGRTTDCGEILSTPEEIERYLPGAFLRGDDVLVTRRPPDPDRLKSSLLAGDSETTRD